MNKIIILLLSVISITCKAQETKEEAIEVLSPQIFHVNSVTSLSGSTRKVVQLKLPANTIRWYYTYSASRDVNKVKEVQHTYNLLAMLSRFIDESGTCAKAINYLGTPPGSDYCDVYLLSSHDDVSKFESKEDYISSKFIYHRPASQEGFVAGTKEVTDPKHIRQTQYLGFRNKSMSYGVDVSLQVVAIVSKNDEVSWTTEQKDDLYKSLRKELIKSGLRKQLDDDTIDTYVGCIMKKLTKKYSLEKLQALAEYEITEVFKGLSSECVTELNIKIDEL
jgi:hypothetical protein